MRESLSSDSSDMSEKMNINRANANMQDYSTKLENLDHVQQNRADNLNNINQVVKKMMIHAMKDVSIQTDEVQINISS